MTALKSDTGQGFNIGFPKFRAITEAIWLRRKVGHNGMWVHCKAAAGGCACPRWRCSGIPMARGAGVGRTRSAPGPEELLVVCTTGFHRALAKWGEEKGIISLPQQHSGAWETGCVHTVPCVGLEGARTVPA